MSDTPRPQARSSGSKLDARLTAATRLPPGDLRTLVEQDGRPGPERSGRFFDPQGSRFEVLAPGDAPSGGPVWFGLRVGPEGKVIASVLIRFTGSAATLESRGVRISRVRGQLAAAEASIDVIRGLTLAPDVVFVQLATPVFPLLGTSVPSMCSDQQPCPQPLRGAGVVIGVIDIDGIDLYHPDFLRDDPSGRATRIEAIWDQTSSGTGGDRVPFGVDYRQADIERDLASGLPYSVVCARPDGEHGTHVAGIASGNGAASRGENCGVAPEATLVFVRLRALAGVALGSSLDLCEALEYVFERAAGRPCVVNVSLGTRRGPRDGSDLVEEWMDELLREAGRAIVIAAGNDGESRRHLSGSIPESKAARIEMQVPSATSIGETVEIWCRAGGWLQLSLTGPDGTTAGPFPPGVYRAALGGADVIVASIEADARNGEDTMAIVLQPLTRGRRLDPGLYTIELGYGSRAETPRQEGRFWAVLEGSTRIGFCNATPGRMSILSPASARGVIAVGNHVHHAGGVPSSTSSRGPTRDGRKSPVLTAPGTAILSAMASWDPAGRLLPYCRKSGTSMAAPHVAGLAALALQKDGALDAKHLRSGLVDQADREGSGGDWDPARGWGRARIQHHSESEEEPAMKFDIRELRTTRRNPTPVHTGDQLQVDIGNFEILDGETKVGEVWVEYDPDYNEDPSRLIEHWCLFASYHGPRSSGSDVSLRFHYNELHTSTADFLAWIRTLSGARYIKSTCHEVTP